jgi:hypothetical protein
MTDAASRPLDAETKAQSTSAPGVAQRTGGTLKTVRSVSSA